MMGRRSTRVANTAAGAALLLCSAAFTGCTDKDPGGGPAPAPDGGATSDELYRLIDARVGGISKLMVPSDDDLPPLRRPDGSLDAPFKSTPAKVALGQYLYFDPVRTNQIEPGYGGDVRTAQTASCGSCHTGRGGTKAGELNGGALGHEGFGYFDPAGNFHARRRVLPGCEDLAPTLTQVMNPAFDPSRPANDTTNKMFTVNGNRDCVDRVGRLVPSMVMFAFNNRFLAFGLAGQPSDAVVNANPDGLPGPLNITQATLEAHRMVGGQLTALRKIPAYVKLFAEAYPEEAAAARARGAAPDSIITDRAVFEALTAFLRTVVTRETPFDRFLRGDTDALTAKQREGARLFFASAKSGGADCVACHSGPALNKQLGDEAGLLVEENFVNIGLRPNHPLFNLNATAMKVAQAVDHGRKDVTRDDRGDFAFKVPTLRQLKSDGALFMHNGLFKSVREVVEYFNAGAPQDPEGSGKAPSLDVRFTHPRGGNVTGLGLRPDQVDALTAFLEEGLYDPGLLNYDPRSTTRTFEPNETALVYSRHRKDLAAPPYNLKDGLMPSGLAPVNDDPLSRRDRGFDAPIQLGQPGAGVGSVSGAIASRKMVIDSQLGPVLEYAYSITNNSALVVDTHLLLVVSGLPADLRVANATGMTVGATRRPYLSVFLGDGLMPGETIVARLYLAAVDPVKGALPDPAKVTPTVTYYSGQGTPRL